MCGRFACCESLTFTCQPAALSLCSPIQPRAYAGASPFASVASLLSVPFHSVLQDSAFSFPLSNAATQHYLPPVVHDPGMVGHLPPTGLFTWGLQPSAMQCPVREIFLDVQGIVVRLCDSVAI